MQRKIIVMLVFSGVFGRRKGKNTLYMHGHKERYQFKKFDLRVELETLDLMTINLMFY